MSGYEELSIHIGHEIECTGYGEEGKPPWHNIAIECMTCMTVLIDYDYQIDEPEQSVIKPPKAIKVGFKHEDEIGGIPYGPVWFVVGDHITDYDTVAALPGEIDWTGEPAMGWMSKPNMIAMAEQFGLEWYEG